MSLKNERKSLEPYLKDSVDFYQHQVSGVRQMIRMRNFLLADEMGLGKSLQAITVAVADIFQERAEKLLVIAPVTLKENWKDEFEKFTTIDATVFGVQPDPKKPERYKALGPKDRSIQLETFAAQSGPRVLICNYEQIVRHLHELNGVGFDIAIFDEAHYLKNPKSKRTQACHQIQARRNFMLTGTPMLNRVDELWGILHMIDRKKYSKFWPFVNRYAVFGGFKDKQIIGVKNEKELIEELHKVMVRRLKEDVLDLPEVQYIVKRLDLSPGQAKLYSKAEDELEIPLVTEDDPVEIENVLTRLLRLKQICGTTAPFNGVDDSTKLDQAIADALELIQNDHKVVVFTQFRSVLRAFSNRFQGGILGVSKDDAEYALWELHGDVPQADRQALVKEWANDSRPGALVCMLQVAGVGLNMTAARHALFLDKLWVPGLNQQAVDRLHRIGQSETQSVQIIEYHMRGTVEERVEELLTQKSKLFGTIVNDVDFKKKLMRALAERG